MSFFQFQLEKMRKRKRRRKIVRRLWEITLENLSRKSWQLGMVYLYTSMHYMDGHCFISRDLKLLLHCRLTLNVSNQKLTYVKIMPGPWGVATLSLVWLRTLVSFLDLLLLIYHYQTDSCKNYFPDCQKPGSFFISSQVVTVCVRKTIDLQKGLCKNKLVLW